MADIELIIKIDEEQYEFIKQNMTMHEVKNYHAFLYDICGCIKNGTPLPKEHGRLIDADKLLKEKVCFEDFDGDTFNIIHEETVINADTIIEANKESK